MAKKINVHLFTMTFICEKMKHPVVIARDDLYLSGGSQDCELCGSHGEIEVAFDCECGNRHDIELHSW